MAIPDGWSLSEEWQDRSDANLRAHGWDEDLAPLPTVMFHESGLRVLIGREPTRADPVPRWHISASFGDRLPTWEEMVKVAHELRPGVIFCIAVPPRSMWMNVHPHTLHLYELRDAGLESALRDNGRGHRPT